MNDKISVIMAAYNCEKTVGKAIDSILAQTYENWVMIICDVLALQLSGLRML